MHWITRLYITVAFAAALTVHTVATFGDTGKGEKVKPPQPIVEPTPGYYEAEGVQTTRDGERKYYSGIALIDKVGETYFCQWNVVGNVFSGVGVFHDGILSVGWTGEGGKLCGTYHLKLNADGSLDGRWATIPGNGVSHRETLKLLRKMPAKKKEV